MSTVHELYSFEYDPDTEVLTVVAEVSDAVLAYPATLYEPEHWTHGKCSASFIYPVEDLRTLSRSSILLYINENESIDWFLEPLDNSLETAELNGLL